MPILTRWHDADHTIIYQEYTDPWDVDEYLAASTEVQQMMDSVDHIVHWLGVVDAKSTPDDILVRLHEINCTPSLNHPRIGASVIVTTVPLVKSIARIYGMVYQPFHLFKSIEEAEKFIEAWQPPR
ncbi:MAG: hypothetical protein JXJ17_14390 [Anaerolineae bacterium]|nr:hypothetical protein [Anaerolineae bacterium]